MDPLETALGSAEQTLRTTETDDNRQNWIKCLGRLTDERTMKRILRYKVTGYPD